MIYWDAVFSTIIVISSMLIAFTIGSGLMSDHDDAKVIKGQAIYINDHEYRCKQVTP